MPEWFYAENDQQHGPVTIEQLTELFAAGTLTPTDLVWREGMAEWLPASRMVDLFPATPKTLDSSTSDSSPGGRLKAAQAKVAPSAANLGGDAETETAISTDDSLSSRFKSAGQLAAHHGIRTKLVNVTLPSAYRALGRHIYQAKLYRDEFPEMYQELDHIAAEMKAIKTDALARPATAGLAAKAKAAALSAKDMGQTKAIEMKGNQALRRLGEVAYEKHGERSAPTGITQPVASASAQLADLDAKIALLSAANPGRKITPRRIVIAGVVVVAVFVLGLAYFFLGSGDAAFRNKLQGEWSGDGVSMTFQGDSVLLTEGNETKKASYSTKPSSGRVIIRVPDSDTTLTATLTNSNTLQVESSLKFGEVLLLHRTSPVADDSGDTSRNTSSENGAGGNGEHVSGATPDRVRALMNVQPGMSGDTVRSLLGSPDEITPMNNPVDSRHIEIWTWSVPGSTTTIKLALSDGAVTNGGTPGYEIGKGFQSAP